MKIFQAQRSFGMSKCIKNKDFFVLIKEIDSKISLRYHRYLNLNQMRFFILSEHNFYVVIS